MNIYVKCKLLFFLIASIFHVNSPPTVEESLFSALKAAPPPLLRSTTNSHALPAALNPDYTYDSPDGPVRVQRTPVKYEPLLSIVGELPDSIQEIVFATLEKLEKKE